MNDFLIFHRKLFFLLKSRSEEINDSTSGTKLDQVKKALILLILCFALVKLRKSMLTGESYSLIAEVNYRYKFSYYSKARSRCDITYKQ